MPTSRLVPPGNEGAVANETHREGQASSPEVRSNPMRTLMVLLLLCSLIACGDTSTESNSTRPEIVDIWTPAAMGDIAVLKTRLAKTEDVNAPDPTFRTTAIGFAANFGRTAAVELLLEANADPNARNGNGSTPALAAAFFGRPECLKLLLDAGADPSLADESGTTTYTALLVPWDITKAIADLLRMPMDQQVLEAGRTSCRTVLERHKSQ